MVFSSHGHSQHMRVSVVKQQWRYRRRLNKQVHLITQQCLRRQIECMFAPHKLVHDKRLVDLMSAQEKRNESSADGNGERAVHAA